MALKIFKKNRQYVPYSFRLLASMFAVTIVVAGIIGIMLCELALQLIQDMENTMTQRNVQNAGQSISRTLGSVDDFSLELISSSMVQRFAHGEYAEDEEEREQMMLKEYLTQKVLTTQNQYGFQSSFVNIYLENGDSVILNDSVSYTNYEECLAYYQSSHAVQDKRYVPMTWVDAMKTRDMTGKTVNNLIWVRFIYDNITLDKIGVVVGGIRDSAVMDNFSAFSHAYLCQISGDILSATDNELFQDALPEALSQSIQNADTAMDLIHYEDSDLRAYYWKDSYYSLAAVIPVERVQKEMSSLTAWYTISAIVAIAIGVLAGSLVNYYLTKKLSRSIQSLTSVVQSVDRGDLTARYTMPGKYDEIAYLGEHVNHMLESLDQFYCTQEKEALARKELEIQLLQSQINPHLLYNTLNSVALAVKSGQGQTAQDLLYTLSDFIRLSLSKGRTTVPLSTEIELIKKYIVLQKIASHRDIRLELDIPEELLSAVVIRTSLQPIVENSVIHGLAGYRDDGCIEIRARLLEDGKTMTVSVRDNGLGIEQDMLEELNKTINTKDYKEMAAHFGLYNVNWRIKYTWGSEQYGLSLESEVSDFTEVKMTLPYISG